MRIGFDARTLRDGCPIGRYVHNLLVAMQPQLEGDSLVILYDPEVTRTSYDLGELAVRFGVQTVPFPVSPAAASQQWDLPRLARDLRLDILHAPYYVTAYLGLPCPLVLSLFDLIPLAYPVAMPRIRDRLAYWVAVRLALRAAQRVLVPSQATLADLTRFYGRAALRASVIPWAAGPRFRPASDESLRQVREAYRVPSRYILHVGGNEPHQNLPNLLLAYAIYHSQTPVDSRAALLLVGPHLPPHFDARQWASQRNLGQAVLTLASVPDERLGVLYAGAACVVVPSLYEGFGLPVLEAMACGAPVLASAAGALPEIVGEAAPLLDPHDVGAWAEAMACVLGDEELETRLRGRSLAQAQAFSWTTSAAATLAEYRAFAQ